MLGFQINLTLVWNWFCSNQFESRYCCILIGNSWVHAARILRSGFNPGYIWLQACTTSVRLRWARIMHNLQVQQRWRRNTSTGIILLKMAVIVLNLCFLRQSIQLSGNSCHFVIPTRHIKTPHWQVITPATSYYMHMGTENYAIS